MRKRKLLWTSMLVIVFVPLLALSLLSSGIIQRQGKTLRTDYWWTTISPPRESHGGPKIDRWRGFCGSNLRQVTIAMRMYAQDSAGRLPLIQSGNGKGWAEQLQPYLKRTVVYQCPQQGALTPNANPNKGGYTDYWYNRNLSGRPFTALASAQTTFSLGEGNDGTDLTDARYNKASLPPAWLTNTSKPPHRHLERALWADTGANYAYVDGHVRWLKPNQIKAAMNQRNPFAIK